MKKYLILLCMMMCWIAILPAQEAKAIKIGMSKIVSHPALDAVEQGVQDELKALGIEAEYDLQNANGDIAAAATIARKFRSDQVDFAIGIATPTAQALANVIKDIPVIYTAVTDPVAAGLVESYDAGEKNVTGVSDLTPVHEQIAFLQSIFPISTLGHIYTSGEDNAAVLAASARKTAEKLSLKYVEATVANTAEVRSAFLSIANRIDALYISTDNTVVSAMAPIIELAKKRGIAIMSADPSSATEHGGILAAWGFDYYKMGRRTGKLIAEIVGGKKISDIPTIYMTEPSDSQLLINLDVAKDLGISIDYDIVSNADILISKGKVVEDEDESEQEDED